MYLSPDFYSSSKCLYHVLSNACSLEGLFTDDSVNSLDDTSLQLKYFHCSQSEGINSGDVAFLAGLLLFLLLLMD